ncbi:MAG: PadR family transcriptional regulator [Gemmatimonadetes bacterium]|nr:PadR family transcriptional regulator [Gemmatimonadota bacterium]
MSNSVFLHGALDLLILRVLREEALHGWAISRRIRTVSRAALDVSRGSLCPALHRLERKGWIAAEWGTSENNRSAKFYRLTARGRRRLSDQTAGWQEFASAVHRVLQHA